jgi:hypothetical protein
MSDRKRSPDSDLLGQQGINLIEEILLDMGHLWNPSGPLEYGIDGHIELRDARAQEPLNRHLDAQSKARTSFTAETDQGFEFLCKASDIDYWMRDDCPVLLICSHPKTREAWFIVVTDWFADKERRAERRVFFDKHRDRFDASKAAELLRLAERREPILHRRPAAPPEQLLTNLLPIIGLSDRIWSAPCDCRTTGQVGELYDTSPGPRPSDYLLRDDRLYSLRDPRSRRLSVVCDAEETESFDARDWSESSDRKLTRYWADLLRRTLLQQVKPQLQWRPDRRVFYFAAPDPLEELSIQGPAGARLVVKVEHYLHKKTGEQRVSYVRHQAFRPGFLRADGRWHLEIEPDYLFTTETGRAHWRGDELLAGIKRFDRNDAVVGHLKMWEHLLSRPASLLDEEPALLTFGSLVCVEVPVGIDDALWRGAAPGPKTIDGQEELAA